MKNDNNNLEKVEQIDRSDTLHGAFRIKNLFFVRRSNRKSHCSNLTFFLLLLLLLSLFVQFHPYSTEVSSCRNRMLKALLSDLSDYRVLFFPSSLSFLVIEFNKSGSSDCVEIRAIYISKKKFYNLFVRRPRSTGSDRSTLQIRSTH